MRTIALALASLAAAAATARADVIPQFVGVPTTYVPGTAFTFELRAPGLTAFTDFNFDLVIETTSLDPVNLMSLTVDRPADSSYPFGSAGTFNASSGVVLGSNLLTYSINGATGGAAVNTTAGASDLLATVTVTPLASLSEPITFSVDPRAYNFGALTETGQVLQPPDPVTVFPADVPPTGIPVPGPGGAALLGLGGIVVLARKRFTRRA